MKQTVALLIIWKSIILMKINLPKNNNNNNNNNNDKNGCVIDFFYTFLQSSRYLVTLIFAKNHFDCVQNAKLLHIFCQNIVLQAIGTG